jgi:hypothetical protein
VQAPEALHPRQAPAPFPEARAALAAEIRATREAVGAKTEPTPSQDGVREAQRRRGESRRSWLEQQKRRAFVTARQRAEAEVVADPRRAKREVDRRIAQADAAARVEALVETTGKAVDLGDGNFFVGNRAQRRAAARRQK